MMKAATTRTRGQGEAGTSLILALAFLTLLGAFTAGVLTVAYTSFKTTEVVRGAQDKDYGADGGADVAVQLLRSSSSYCPAVSGTPTNLPDQTIDGRTVHITCQTLSGNATGGPGGSLLQYALVVTGYNNPNGSAPNLDDAIKLTGSTHANISYLKGPVFNAGGFSLSATAASLQITSDLHQYNDPPKLYCTASKAAAATVGPVVSGTWTCELAATFPVPDPTPTLIVPSATAHAPVVQGTCTILFPGRYTSAPVFTRNQKFYLASGVYYFHNVGVIDLRGEIFGGQAPAGETKQVNATPCATDATANSLVPGSASGSGVELVLGGTSKLTVDDHPSAKIEMFSRVPAIPASEGTPGVSVYAPRVSGGNWSAWNTDKVLSMAGNKASMTFHGAFYAPDAPIDPAHAILNPNDYPLFAGGVVAQKINIAFDNAGGLLTSTLSGIVVPPVGTPRTVVVTATADPIAAGEAPTVVKAVVQLDTSAGTPATVLSWRKV